MDPGGENSKRYRVGETKRGRVILLIMNHPHQKERHKNNSVASAVGTWKPEETIMRDSCQRNGDRGGELLMGKSWFKSSLSALHNRGNNKKDGGWYKDFLEPTSPAASDDEPKVSVPATPVVKVKAEAAKVKATPASARGAKRKSMHDFVEDLAAQDRSQRLKVAKMRETIKEGQKTAREKAKYDVKSNLEMARGFSTRNVKRTGSGSMS
ncbi:hypothetical protein B0H14DRAFT_2605721 [Mycena olivaceomarginata]|nr:hypothetical protein B0H14DRAFT_2605721 [Mycena olivaceomarginata]